MWPWYVDSMGTKKHRMTIKVLSREPDETQREEAMIFRALLQKSSACAKFRKAWNIPPEGFKRSERKDYPEYASWYANLIRITNDYYNGK